MNDLKLEVLENVTLETVLSIISTKTVIVVRQLDGLGIYEDSAVSMFNSEFFSNNRKAVIQRVQVNDNKLIVILSA